MTSHDTFEDYLIGGAMLSGMSLLFIWILAWILNYFVALTARPHARAGWLTGLGYFITVISLTFSDMPVSPLLLPLLALPGAAFTYWYWYSGFRRSWIEDPADLPDDVVLENDDWRAGLVKLVGLIAAATVIVLIRRATGNG